MSKIKRGLVEPLFERFGYYTDLSKITPGQIQGTRQEYKRLLLIRNFKFNNHDK